MARRPRALLFSAALVGTVFGGLGLASSAAAFRPSSSPCDLIKVDLAKVLGLPEVWERPSIGPRGATSPDVVSSCRILAWEGNKPATQTELDQRIMRGTAAAGYIRTWVANPRSPDARTWRLRRFQRTLNDVTAGCATLAKQPHGGKLRLPLYGGQSALGYEGVNVGLDACGVWDRGRPHPTGARTATRDSTSAPAGLASYRIVTLQLQQSEHKPVAYELAGISKYLVGGFWHTNILPLLHLYWTTCPQGNCSPASGAIWRANLDGSNPHTVVTGEVATGIADDGSHLYWTACTGSPCDVGTGRIRQSNLNGSNRHTIVSGMPYAFPGLAVDNGYIYWTEYCTDFSHCNGVGAPNGTINRARVNGRGLPIAIVSRQDFPWGIAVNSSHVYWTNSGPTPPVFGGSVNEANLDGGSPHSIVTGQLDPDGMGLTSSHVYWANNGEEEFQDSSISEANLDGSNPQPIDFNPIACDPESVAIAPNKVYWFNYCDDTIKSVNLDGSNPQKIIAGPQSGIGGLAVGR